MVERGPDVVTARCRRYGHPRETTGAQQSCRQCERDRSQWVTALGLLAKFFRQQGMTVEHRPRQTTVRVVR